MTKFLTSIIQALLPRTEVAIGKVKAQRALANLDELFAHDNNDGSTAAIRAERDAR